MVSERSDHAGAGAGAGPGRPSTGSSGDDGARLALEALLAELAPAEIASLAALLTGAGDEDRSAGPGVDGGAEAEEEPSVLAARVAALLLGPSSGMMRGGGSDDPGGSAPGGRRGGELQTPGLSLPTDGPKLGAPALGGDASATAAPSVPRASDVGSGATSARGAGTTLDPDAQEGFAAVVEGRRAPTAPVGPSYAPSAPADGVEPGPAAPAERFHNEPRGAGSDVPDRPVALTGSDETSLPLSAVPPGWTRDGRVPLMTDRPDLPTADGSPSAGPTRAGAAGQNEAGAYPQAEPRHSAAALVLRLSERLTEDTPLEARGLQEALALLWSALPAALADDPSAGAVFLRATAGIAGAGARLADLAALQGAVHDVLAILPSEGDRRLAARTVAARLRHAGVGSPRARTLARAVLVAVVPGLEPEGVAQTAGLVTRVAGLVLLAPYLRMLFERGEVLGSEGRLPADRVARARRLLVLLSGNAEGPADPLERVLLGLPPGKPVEAAAPDAGMEALVDGLLRAVVTQWGALGKTSPDGLREAFLRREGDLILEADGGARLRVAEGPFDMLLDRLPWSIALLRKPWMAGPLHVRWRSHGGR